MSPSESWRWVFCSRHTSSSSPSAAKAWSHQSPSSASSVPQPLPSSSSPRATRPAPLWGSEFGGYDVLEYHLELPQEWLAAGRLSPLDHNAYSYLPSYLEAASMHLGAMTLAPKATATGGAYGLIAGEGYRLMACQFLHAGFTMIAAWLVARLVRTLSPETKVGPAFAAPSSCGTPLDPRRRLHGLQRDGPGRHARRLAHRGLRHES